LFLAQTSGVDAEVHAETVDCPLKLLTAVYVVPPGCGPPEKMFSDGVLVAGTDNTDNFPRNVYT